MWYHDHAYGLTRTNVFAGLVSAYLIGDAQETQLVNSQAIPAPSLGGVAYPLGIPLIIQDKTFWDGAGGADPDYPSVVPAGAQIVEGDLWYPHVYEGGADPDGLPSMAYGDLPASPPNTVNISLPAGVVVSAQGSAKDLNRHPLSAICLIVISRSTVDRANRSNRVTTTTAPGCRVFTRLRSSGRSLWVPLAFSLKTLEHPAFPSSSSWESRL